MINFKLPCLSSLTFPRHMCTPDSSVSPPSSWTPIPRAPHTLEQVQHLMKTPDQGHMTNSWKWLRGFCLKNKTKFSPYYRDKCLKCRQVAAHFSLWANECELTHIRYIYWKSKIKQGNKQGPMRDGNMNNKELPALSGPPVSALLWSVIRLCKPIYSPILAGANNLNLITSMYFSLST